MSNRVKWPDEVPVLTAADMCVGLWHEVRKGRDCGCLDYQVRAALPVETWWWDVEHRPNITSAIHQAHKDIGTGCSYATHTHDEDRGVTRAQVARVWNRAMAYLGYVKNNPECRKDGTLKPTKGKA